MLSQAKQQGEGEGAKPPGTAKEDDLVARWFSKGPRLIVWDFDLTLLCTHAFGEGVEPGDVADRWESDVRDVDLLRRFVKTAQAQRVEVGIASYGRCEVIHEYLKHIFAGFDPPPFAPGKNIITPECLGMLDGTSVPAGKPRMLDLLCARAEPVIDDKTKVIFFDDDDNNIADCIEAGFPHAFHTPEGFSRGALGQLEASAKLATRGSSCLIS